VTPESRLSAEIRLALGTIPGVALWRNSVGHAEVYDGRQVRHISYGLAVGSGDLIGLARGRFVSLEVKTPTGRASAEQLRWVALVRSLGGVAGIVRSVDEARGLIAEALGERPATDPA
jgi:hypothetical protein